MNQDDWSAFLKAQLDDRNPKCGNCEHWRSEGPSRKWMGKCEKIEWDEQEPNYFVTDLSLCSAWEKAPSKPDPE